eukprot:TRINITY_DN760_c0_g1_i2.p2 TRINITY_DN760_c0_g1~~TRINITY_DN760_c0_g1_i2.p2  ORF type:complete len:83 (-),score=14.93 TRINITY_DN760_c0_g1_i2:256-504(-)
MGKGSNVQKKQTRKERQNKNKPKEAKSTLQARKNADAVAPVCKACMAVFLPPNHKLKGLQAHYANCSKAQQKSFSLICAFHS